MADEQPLSAGLAAPAVVREMRIDASPEIVWSFLVDPEKVVRWKGVSAEVDARPGGVRRIDMHGNRDISSGTHLVVEPYRRLVFTWGWEGSAEVPPGSSTVEVTLTPDGNATVLRLEHRDLPTEKDRTEHAAGWEHFLARLAVAAPGGDPGPDVFMP